jgi:hypothetical protein
MIRLDATHISIPGFTPEGVGSDTIRPWTPINAQMTSHNFKQAGVGSDNILERTIRLSARELCAYNAVDSGPG